MAEKLKDKYELDTMDIYSVAVNKTTMENATFFAIELDEEINEERLIKAIKKAIEYNPLFGCKVVDKNNRSYLEKNDKPIKVFNVKEEDRPKVFVNGTNDYCFQITYYKNHLTFEWYHIITDGAGAVEFLYSLLNAYFDRCLDSIPEEFDTDVYLKALIDKNAKPLGRKQEPKGFNNKYLPIEKRGYKCMTHIIRVPVEDVIKISKRAESTPAAVFVPLLSRAIRKNLPTNIKNRNVSCNVMINVRDKLKIKTMHNAAIGKVLTYTDAMDKHDFDMIATCYRSMLDLAVQEENIVYNLTDTASSIDLLMGLRKLKLNKPIASIIKNSMNNVVFTYISRLHFDEVVKSHIKKIDARSWPDIGNLVIAMIDFDGTFVLDITENYKNKNIVLDFLKELEEHNIRYEYEEPFIFEQANARWSKQKN